MHASMTTRTIVVIISLLGSFFASATAAPNVAVTGELREWHKITLTIDGPQTRETAVSPNPFLDCRMEVTFIFEEDGSERLRCLVPGYFAADGNAGESSAGAGNKWRAHLAPDKAGTWNYTISFVAGPRVAVDRAALATPVDGCDGLSGSFVVGPTDKQGRDFRSEGRLEYVGRRYLRFAGSRRDFLKAGADSPENLLAYADFDGTYSAKAAGVTRANEANTTALKTWAPHVRDWREGDPTWRGGKGKGLIGALNYLAGAGMNSVSFLTYNAGGDGDDVWPFIARDDKLHYDCSKLDQWQIVLDHAQKLGLHLHFKLQETENDDNRLGDRTDPIPVALDGGDLGVERRLYLRELVARYGYELALNWNLGEENTQTPEQQRAMARFIRETDPYPHPIVLHTYPNAQDDVYPKLTGDRSELTGVSLQNSWETSHARVLHWIEESTRAGKPWAVAHDEQNPHYTGVPPDKGWEGFDGTARPERNSRPYTIDDIRKYTLWGTLMAGGAGVEYYFGYTLPQTDLSCQDWRSRAQSWEYCRIALEFFGKHIVMGDGPEINSRSGYTGLHNADELVGNPQHDNSRYCLAARGEVYVVYLPNGGTCELDLDLEKPGFFRVYWYDPRHGGPLLEGSVKEVVNSGRVSIGGPPAEADEDWVAVVQTVGSSTRP
jgi:hypothetical protein